MIPASEQGPALPGPELHLDVDIRYRCRECGDLMAPADAVIVDGHSWHPEHAPASPGPGS